MRRPGPRLGGCVAPARGSEDASPRSEARRMSRLSADFDSGDSDQSRGRRRFETRRSLQFPTGETKQINQLAWTESVATPNKRNPTPQSTISNQFDC